jgi:nucleoside 2-deoxyribosyltransferase
MRFYIASRTENADAVRRLADTLKAAGHVQTYDWTTHCDVKHEGGERLKEVAKLEVAGVTDADVVIVLLPGGRGMHTEFGIAIGKGKKIILCSKDGAEFEEGDATTTFYWLPDVYFIKRATGIPALIKRLA